VTLSVQEMIFRHIGTYQAKIYARGKEKNLLTLMCENSF
jgi:hypothetical protein